LIADKWVRVRTVMVSRMVKRVRIAKKWVRVMVEVMVSMMVVRIRIRDI